MRAYGSNAPEIPAQVQPVAVRDAVPVQDVSSAPRTLGQGKLARTLQHSAKARYDGYGLLYAPTWTGQSAWGMHALH